MEDTDRTDDRNGRLNETLKCRVSADLRARVKARAARERRSEGAITRFALERYLADEPEAAAA